MQPARAVLIVNPHASGVTPEVVAAVERALAAGGPVVTKLTEESGHAVELAQEACRTCDLIYVLSGDGGYNEVVNGITVDLPIGFLPGGGTSVLPRALGLPRDPVAAARALTDPSRIRRISLGRVRWEGAPGGRRFTFSAGLGLDAELIRAVDRLGRGHDGKRPGDLAFVRELGRILLAHRGRLEPALTVAGVGRAAAALVANCDPYTYVGRVPVHVAPESRFELGLDLVAPVRVGPTGLPVLAWWALARPGQTRSGSVLYVHDADTLEVTCDRPLPLQVDGEDLGDAGEVVFEAERNALSALVP
jgi:diacylglycerol kinase family enzyme